MRIRRRKRESGPLVRACCVCGRIQKDDVWVHDHESESARRTHTYCPECLVVEVRRNFPESVNTALALCKAG
jgi:hypothetical protein